MAAGMGAAMTNPRLCCTRCFDRLAPVGRDSLARQAVGARATGGLQVKAFLAACLAVIVLAAISWIVLNSVQEPVDRAFATSNADSALGVC